MVGFVMRFFVESEMGWDGRCLERESRSARDEWFIWTIGNVARAPEGPTMDEQEMSQKYEEIHFWTRHRRFAGP